MYSFRNAKFYLVFGKVYTGPVCVNVPMPNVIEIGQTIAKIS